MSSESSRSRTTLAEHQVTAISVPTAQRRCWQPGPSTQTPCWPTATAADHRRGGPDPRALGPHDQFRSWSGIGDADGAAAAEALAAGATACVAHPYRLRELLPILRAIRPDGLAEPQPPLEVGGLRLDPGGPRGAA